MLQKKILLSRSDNAKIIFRADKTLNLASACLSISGLVICQVFESPRSVEMQPILVLLSISLNALKRKTFDTASKIPQEKWTKRGMRWLKLLDITQHETRRAVQRRCHQRPPELQMLLLWHYLDERAVCWRLKTSSKVTSESKVHSYWLVTLISCFSQHI